MTFSICDFLSGWGAGVCGLLVGHPADTIKVRQQISGNAGIIKIFKSCIKNEGILSLYKGLSFPLLCAGTQNAIFFGVYGNTFRILQKYDRGEAGEQTGCGETSCNQSYYLNAFLAGCAGGFVQCFSGCPVDLIKIKLQVKSGIPEALAVTKAMKKIYKDSGWTGFYQGFRCMLCRDIVSSGIYMLTYVYFVSSETQQKDVTRVLLTGGLAGTLSWISIIPLDVIKSRIQSDDPQKPQYKGMKDCFIKCYNSGGIAVFGRGFWMISLRAFPTNAATFIGYEWFMNLCHSADNK